MHPRTYLAFFSSAPTQAFRPPDQPRWVAQRRRLRLWSPDSAQRMATVRHPRPGVPAGACAQEAAGTIWRAHRLGGPRRSLTIYSRPKRGQPLKSAPTAGIGSGMGPRADNRWWVTTCAGVSPPDSRLPYIRTDQGVRFAHYYARLIKANNRPLSAVLQPVARQLENIRADTTWFGGAY